MNCNARAVGVGLAYRGSTPYWTQDFGRSVNPTLTQTVAVPDRCTERDPAALAAPAPVHPPGGLGHHRGRRRRLHRSAQHRRRARQRARPDLDHRHAAAGPRRGGPDRLRRPRLRRPRHRAGQGRARPLGRLPGPGHLLRPGADEPVLDRAGRHRRARRPPHRLRHAAGQPGPPHRLDLPRAGRGAVHLRGAVGGLPARHRGGRAARRRAPGALGAGGPDRACHELMRGRGARFGLATSEASLQAAHLAAV